MNKKILTLIMLLSMTLALWAKENNNVASETLIKRILLAEKSHIYAN